MTLLTLALQSLKHRTSGFLASFICVFLGAGLLMSFVAQFESSRADGIDQVSEETLFTVATVAGLWCLLIVVFAVISTLSLAVQQRGQEMALLKSIGATPGQITRMIAAETALLSLVAALLAILPGMLGGRLIFSLLQNTDQVAGDVSFSFGVLTAVIGVVITLVAAVIAALATARRTAGLRASAAMTQSAVDNPGLSRKRLVAAGFFLMTAVSTGVVTIVVFSGKGSDAMQSSGQSSIWASIGFALLAPALVRFVLGVLSRPIEILGGVSGYLTVQNVRQRTGQMASAAMPVILFTGIAVGTVYLQVIDNNARRAEGALKTDVERNIETLNFVVIGMIALFAAIMLVNMLMAAITHRRKEFGQQRLVGATRSQVLRMVALESLVLAVTGVVFGSIASLATIVPYTIARTDGVVPDASIFMYLGIAGVAVVLTLGASLGAARRAVAPPAMETLAG